MTFDLAQMIANMTPITPAQRQEQRIGFCFSGLKADTKLTREAVAQMDYAIHGNLTALEDEIIRLTARVAELEGEVATVNPLVWKPSGFEGNRKAGGLGLGYFIECAARQFSCSVSDGSGSLFKVLYRGASEEAAKAAAQADYDARIRAALSTHTEELKT